MSFWALASYIMLLLRQTKVDTRINGRSLTNAGKELVVRKWVILTSMAGKKKLSFGQIRRQPALTQSPSDSLLSDSKSTDIVALRG